MISFVTGTGAVAEEVKNKKHCNLTFKHWSTTQATRIKTTIRVARTAILAVGKVIC